jgi:hypothetical protein
MKLFLLALVLCVLPCFAFAQSTPPIDTKMFQSPGKVVLTYDEFTDKTRVSVFIRLINTEASGLGLVATGFYNGKTPTDTTTVNLFFVFISEKAEHKDEPLYFLIDGERVEVKPIYFATRSPDDVKSLEILMLPSDLTPAQLYDLGTAKTFRGRIGGYLEFELNAADRQLLADVAAKLQRKQK